MKVTITHFPGGLYDTQGRRIELEWGDLGERLITKKPFQGRNHTGFSGATYKDDKRSRANLERVDVLGLDYDKGQGLDDTKNNFQSVDCIQYTTKSHTPGCPRHRLMILLSRPISATEYDDLWLRLAAVTLNPDENAKDPSRFWYTPGVHPGGEFIGRVFEGEPLDVDHWLAKPCPRPVSIAPTELPAELHDHVSLEDAVRRARRYMDAYPGAISGSDGHKTTFWAAVALSRGFLLSDAAAMVLLREYNSRCAPKWSEGELSHKLASARAATRIGKPDGWLLYARAA